MAASFSRRAIPLRHAARPGADAAEGSDDDEPSIFLQRDAVHAAGDIDRNGRVVRAIGIEPHDAVVQHSADVDVAAADEEFPIGLQRERFPRAGRGGDERSIERAIGMKLREAGPRHAAHGADAAADDDFPIGPQHDGGDLAAADHGVERGVHEAVRIQPRDATRAP